MLRRIALLAVLTPMVCAWARGQGVATSSDAAAVSTSTCQPYPQVTCTSSDALACETTTQLAGDTRDELAPLLQLGKSWRFPVHVHVMAPGDPLMAKVDHEAVGVFTEGTTMRIEAVLPAADPDGREFVQREFITALVWEKYFASTKTFDATTRLDAVPLWLVEGLRERINDDPDHVRESIVNRAVKSGTAPSLEEIISWRELSDDRLLGLWQRAFSFYLVDSLVRDDAARVDFQLWLAGLSSPNGSAARLHFPTETAWQRELADAAARSRDIIYSWDETQSELAAAETITFAAGKTAEVQTCQLDEATALPHTKVVVEALQERILVLTALQLRAHPSWQAIIDLYRAALTSFIHDPDRAHATALMAEARLQRNNQVTQHGKLVDYLNWFEVTHDYSSNASHFRDYFYTAQEMGRVEADPSHPNPIRADLLKMESEL